jgi:hypothetical protein
MYPKTSYSLTFVLSFELNIIRKQCNCQVTRTLVTGLYVIEKFDNETSCTRNSQVDIF